MQVRVRSQGEQHGVSTGLEGSRPRVIPDGHTTRQHALQHRLHRFIHHTHRKGATCEFRLSSLLLFECWLRERGVVVTLMQLSSVMGVTYMFLIINDSTR
jgi:hypothetical protein